MTELAYREPIEPQELELYNAVMLKKLAELGPDQQNPNDADLFPALRMVRILMPADLGGFWPQADDGDLAEILDSLMLHATRLPPPPKEYLAKVNAVLLHELAVSQLEEMGPREIAQELLVNLYTWNHECQMIADGDPGPDN